MRIFAALAVSALVTGLAANALQAQDTDARWVERLRSIDSATLQWIGWDQRGHAHVRGAADAMYLTASQHNPNGPGSVFVDGQIVEMGEDYFILDGLVRISDAPDVGRTCQADKKWRFAITQNRKYFRLREFEWCDGLTDYVDLYFRP